MKNLTLLITATIAIASFLTSCEDDHEHTGPTVTINGPSGTFHTGDTVVLDITFTDDHELHEYLVTVTREHDDTLVHTVSGHHHEATLTISEPFEVETTMHSDFRIDATVSNHDGMEATATSTFHVHPM